jgi:hypothetical protein
MAVKAVREVSPFSPGSGVQLRELITLPRWLIVTGEILQLAAVFLVWCVRHYVVTGMAVLWVCGWVQFGTWWAGLLVLPVVPAAYWVSRIALLLHASEATTVKAVIVGMQRAAKLRRAWPGVLHQLKITSRADRDAVAPLNGLLPTNAGLTGTVITGAVALPSSKLTKLEPELASGLFCDRVTVRPLTPSMASIRFDWGQHLRQKYRLCDLPELPQTEADKPAWIRFGVRADGHAATLKSNLSTLIGGMSDGGKSSAIWAIIAGYVEAVPVRLRVVDLSGVEFKAAADHLGKGLVHDYVGNQYVPGARKLEEFWEDLEAAFTRRLISLEKSGKRWHRPTEEEPLDVLILDEILPIAAELRKEATEHIVGRICYLGRKAGFVCIAASQAGQVDAIGRIRDLWPQRLAFRTASRFLTDAFLGDGAHSDGARASELDLAHDQGVGYMAADGVRGYISFRSAWVPDSETKQIAQKIRPMYVPSNLRNKATAQYMFWDSSNTEIYTGIAEAGRVETRWAEHARSKSWWPEVARKEIVQTWPDRETAETAEALTIKKLKPRYNIQHNPIPQQRRSS